MLSEGDDQPMTRGPTKSGITLGVRSEPKRTPTATPGLRTRRAKGRIMKFTIVRPLSLCAAGKNGLKDWKGKLSY